MKVKVSAQNYQNELIYYPYNYYGSFGQVRYPIVRFEAVSPATKKYKEWLGTDNRIFMKPYIKKIPKPLKYCEELFDKDVLEIKQLVKDIGDLNTLIHREQKNFVLYDDSNIISNTFFTELNKNIQSYGRISLQYDYNNEKVTNWKNKLRFKINKNIKKEFITLQLEDILALKKIETEDSKITNISISSVAESKMQTVHEFLIEGLQKFQQYTKINPISVQIIDTSLKNKLAFYSRNYKYKYRFIANSLLFSSAIKENTNAIFMGSMTQNINGFNDAKYQVINGKVFQGIRTIYISEIVNWDKIKTKSHWTNVT